MKIKNTNYSQIDKKIPLFPWVKVQDWDFLHGFFVFLGAYLG